MMGEWTLFSNHGHVLVSLANNHQARLRDVAAEVGITERAVQNILRELQDSGMVQIIKHGRCNHYQINGRKPLRHPLEAHCTVGKLLQLLKSEIPEGSESGAAVEPKPAARKTRIAPKTDKSESTAASAQQVAKKPVAAESVKTETESAKPIEKASKDEKKKKPATDQQGSLF